MNYIKFDYVRNEKIWGYEDWIISSHQNGMSYVNDGKYKGMSLNELYEKNKNLFGIDDEEFPLLVKIIDAKDALSVQVHPNDNYAKEHDNSKGKTECWYILDAKDTDIIIGQKSKSKNELKELIENGKIMETLNINKIEKEDFFYIPSGCVHAIRKNTKILEIQQSSDITYRLYDYDRLDDSGKLRELHVDKSLDVIDYSFIDNNKVVVEQENASYRSEVLTNNEFFIVKKYIVNKEVELSSGSKYLIINVVEGQFTINGNDLKADECIMILKDEAIILKGNGKLITSTSK